MGGVPASNGSSGPAGWSSRGLCTVGYLGLVAGVQMADRGLQAVLLGRIEDSFGVGDEAIGALQGLGGILVASALAVPLGRLADRGSRRGVLLALIACWSLLMVVSALAPNFPLFFIGRAAAGVTEFALIPIVYASIPGLAPERHRVVANLSFAALMATGSSAGFYFGQDWVGLAGGLLPWFEPWRAAMVLLGATGLPLLIGGVFTAATRNTVAVGAVADAGLAPFVRARAKQVALFVGMAGFLLVAVQALNPLIALALERRFAPDPDRLGRALGVILLVATLGCLPVAGLFDRILARRIGTAARPAILGLGTLVALPSLLLLAGTRSFDPALALAFVFLFATCVGNALVPTMLQDLTPEHLRARAFAIWSLVISVFAAVGPLLAGLLSDRVLGGDLLGAVVAVGSVALIFSAGCAAVSIGTVWAIRTRAG